MRQNKHGCRLAALLTVIWMLCLWAVPAQAAARSAGSDALGLSARYAVLIDADTAQVLYAKDCDAQVPMASTTKIMTALLLLEAGEPDFSFAVTQQMVRVEGTSMGLREGDIVSRYALACGMLLASGNDAAQAAALHLEGGLPAFAQRMNQRAAEIGMTRTHFVTPSGLDAEGHYSTAYDMALLGREALLNQEFRAICGQSAIRVSYGNPPYPRTLRNHNRLVRELQGCLGIKTGFTKKAGRCLVSAVEQNGRTLVAVTLKAGSDWADHRKLYDYGFMQYRPIALDDASQPVARLPMAGAAVSYVNVVAAHEPVAYVRVMPYHIRREILLRPFEYAPLPAGKIVGTARYYCDELLLAEVPLLVQSAVEPARPAQAPVKLGLWQRITQFLFRR